MPRDEGGGLMSGGIQFAEDEDGNLIVLLDDFSPEVRGAMRAVLISAFEHGITALNSQMAQIRRSGGKGLVVPMGLKGDG